MNNNKKIVLKITQIAMLVAIVSIFQLIANYVTLGPVSINLSLVIIAISGIVCGPIGGLIVGMFSGLIVIFAPSTQALFFINHPFYTILTCLFKTGIAGLVSGILYKIIKSKKTGVIISSMVVPFINTLIFSLATIFVFKDIYPNGVFDFRYLLLTIIGYNFIIEFIITLLLTNTVYYIAKIVLKRKYL